MYDNISRTEFDAWVERFAFFCKLHGITQENQLPYCGTAQMLKFYSGTRYSGATSPSFRCLENGDMGNGCCRFSLSLNQDGYISLYDYMNNEEIYVSHKYRFGRNGTPERRCLEWFRQMHLQKSEEREQADD